MNKLIIGSLVLLAAGARPGLSAAGTPLPPAIAGQMKSGKRLSKLWISPSFAPAQGFRTGAVDLAVPSLYGEITGYIPTALERVARPESPAVLSLTVTELSTRERSQNNYNEATVGIEGRVLDPAGNLLVAFQTREMYHGAGLMEDCRKAVDTIVAALAGELGLPVRKVVKVKPVPAAAPAAPLASAPSVPQPAPAAAPQAPAAPSKASAGPVLAGSPDPDPASHGHHY